MAPRFTSLIPTSAYRFGHVRRMLLVITAFAFVVGACSNGGDAASTTEGSTPTTTQPADPATSAAGGDGGAAATTTTPDGATTTLSDRPLAPDFTLELGDGGSYTLSEGAKPVYLVFWAEW